MSDKKPAPKHTYWRGETLWARFTVAGREIRESLRTSDAKVARRRVAEMKAKAEGALHFGEIERSWEDVVAEWSTHIVTTVGAKTASRYASSLTVAHPFLTGKAIHAIGRADIDSFIQARRKDGLTNATIKRDLTAVSSVLGYADERDWRDGNPALDRAKTLRERRDPITLPQSASISYLLTRCEPMFAAVINTARFTGLRLDEIRNLHRRDFNAAARTLHVRKAKGNKQRAIDLTARAVEVLSSVPASLATPCIFHADGDGLNDISSTFRSKVRWAQIAAQKDGTEFHPMRFHDLRHLYAVEALKSGMSIYTLQQQLGHSSIKVTEGYLAFLTPEQAQKAKDSARGIA